MRFPLRLSASLFKAKTARLFTGSSAHPIIFRLSPCASSLSQSPQSPVIWLSGTEPLLHPEIGRITRAIVDSGRHLFLHTSGCGLRNRIHAFRPDSRLFLTVEFAGQESAHDKEVGRPGAFRRSLEGIRAAKLSGFLVCAHVTVACETSSAEIGELIEFLDAKDVDGFIVSSGGQNSPANAASLAEKLDEVREMIRCSRWEDFSRLLEASYAETIPINERVKLAGTDANAFEESA